MSVDTLVFNGLDADSGEYLLPPLPVDVVAQVAAGQRLDEARLGILKEKSILVGQRVLGPVAGVDPRDLGQAGWGVIFPSAIDPAPIKDALKELLELRRAQASRVNPHFYREFTGSEGVFPDQSALEWLEQRGYGPGPADPEKMPYYLLLVGDPEQIPYQFQYDLDVQYAVGRLHFDTLDEYANYARSVVAAERGQVALPRRACFFGVANPDDPATNLSATELVQPLAKELASEAAVKDWSIQTILPEAATKERLGRLLGGDETPPLLLTASHGAGFSRFETAELAERQRSFQGALVCQEWPGPEEWRGPLKEEFLFASGDVSADARLLGMIAFLFACYGAGTPLLDDFSQIKSGGTPQPIAPRPFLAQLPQRLLGHPKGGALAVVGHVERATGYSFSWPRSGTQTATFRSTLSQLMRGERVGSALEFFNGRYAELATTLSQLQIGRADGNPPDRLRLTQIWTAHNDARSYVILGDPAARLPLAEPAPPQQPAPVTTSRSGVAPTTPRVGPAGAGVTFGVDAVEQGPFNGLDGATGAYLTKPSLAQIVQIARDEALDRATLDALRQRLERRGPEPPHDLSEAGWGVIFPQGADTAIKEALGPLLELRRAQAGVQDERRYQEYEGDRGCRAGETVEQFLARLGAGSSELPAYLLIVGDPERIPYRFEQALATRHMVGRLHFDTPQEYVGYARSVLAAETGAVTAARQAAFFGPMHADDPATSASADGLVAPLAAELRGWQVSTVVSDLASKARLSRLLGGDQTPSLFFAAGHGVGFPGGDARRLVQQGALLCQDWPGPRQHRAALPPEFCFAAGDVRDDARLMGMIAFLLASYSAGAPQEGEQRPFVARLPQRLLGHPQGGALAVVGMAGRAWMRDERAVGIYAEVVKRLSAGLPIGAALRPLGDRYAEVATRLSAALEASGELDQDTIASLWMAASDARSTSILGDPATRLALASVPPRPRRPSSAPGSEPPPSGQQSSSGVTLLSEAAKPPVVPSERSEPRPQAVADEQVPDAARDALWRLVDLLGEALQQPLTIETYTSADMGGVRYDEAGHFTGARLRALTRIGVGGDIQTCLPEQDGAIDQGVGPTHLALVERALAQRAELIKAAAALAQALNARE